MKRSIAALLAAQFLSAFGDNAALFAVIATIMKSGRESSWYIPALQASFLVAFVVLAPWLGRLADQRPKTVLLLLGNLCKAAGAALIYLHLEPMLAYALVGIGAAVYAPAKYGILPELVSEQALVRANGLIEGSTILAIVLGTVLGGQLADRSIEMALLVVIAAFIGSALITVLVPRLSPKPRSYGPALSTFTTETLTFMATPRARFSMIGASVFWAAAAVLRVLLVAWAPLALMLHTAGDIARLTLFLAGGLIVGAGIVPSLITLEKLRRARLAAYVMGILICVLSQLDHLWLARLDLFAIGIASGMFVVPINAALQELGHLTIGSGSAVAIQSFFENLTMLIAIGLYSYAAAHGLAPVTGIAWLGSAVVLATAIITWHLPPDPKTFAVRD